MSNQLSHPGAPNKLKKKKKKLSLKKKKNTAEGVGDALEEERPHTMKLIRKLL